jgi:hypothetical protein
VIGPDIQNSGFWTWGLKHPVPLSFCPVWIQEEIKNSNIAQIIK